jgi:hypothetical protein
MTRFSSKWILSHSTWYKIAGHVNRMMVIGRLTTN